MRAVTKALATALCAIPLLSLTGCSFSSKDSPSTLSGVAIKGSLHGGQAPISGARVYMMAASATAFGSASTSAINAGTADGTDGTGSYVLTQADGSFNVNGGYTCTTGQQLYFLALAGNPGLPGTVDAEQIAQMAPIGECSTISTSTFVNLNEVTTAAMAYALAGFMSTPTQVATSSSSQGGIDLVNAFATFNNLASNGTALAKTPAGNGTVPQQEINTLANILANCVNSDSGSSTPCDTLFTNAQSAGTNGTRPTTTAQAAINIAHNPGSVGISNLYDLQDGFSAFQPALTGNAPPDFSLAISYTASGLNYPEALSVDSVGNIWVPNYGGSLVGLSPTGNKLSTTTPSPNSGDGKGTVVDLNGNIWLNYDGGVEKFDANGNYIATYTGGDLAGSSSYEALAIDASDNIWIAANSSLGAYNSSSGAALTSSSGIGSGYITDVRSDSNGNIWVTDKDGFLQKNTYSAGVFTSTLSFLDGAYGASAPVALAIDANNYICVADSNTNEISHFDQSGYQITYSGGGTNGPFSIAIDGADNIWIANLIGATSGQGAISAFSNDGIALSPFVGYPFASSVSNLVFVAADGSGNLWVSSTSTNTITEFIGLTIPVVTPINPHHLGTTP